MARKSKEHAEKLKAERLKMMENYEEPEWMKMSNVEESLQQIEANLDQSQGGEAGIRGQLARRSEAFLCAHESLYKRLSVSLSVCPSVRPSFRLFVRYAFRFILLKRCFGAPYAVYPALLRIDTG